MFNFEDGSLPTVLDDTIGTGDVNRIEQTKLNQYGSALRDNIIRSSQLVVFAMNTAGEFGPQAAAILSALTLRKATAHGPVGFVPWLAKRRLDELAAIYLLHMQ